MDVPLGDSFYQADSLPLSNRALNNCRVDIPQTENALSTATLDGTEGVEIMTTSGPVNNANRGSHKKEGIPYHLNGETLYRQDSTIVMDVETFTMVPLGTIPGTDRASFADNGVQLIIVVGGLGWIMDETVSPTITPITDPAFVSEGRPEQVVYLDSFFILTLDSKLSLRSAADNGLSWAALDSFTAAADPDDIVAPAVLSNQLILFGTQSAEFYQDIAGIFQRVNGQVLTKGLAAPFGVTNANNSIIFIGGGDKESPAIWQTNGGAAQKISTTPIDTILGRMPQAEIEATFAYSYAKAGAFIVGFTFSDRTFEYNTINGKWNERTSKIKDASGLVSITRWRANSIVKAYNRIICADSIDGRIGSVDSDIYTEYGESIIREFSMPPFKNEGNSFSVSSVELTMEAGVGTSTLDPQIRMSMSKNARTFNTELWRGFGLIGEYARRTIWRKLGRFARYGVLKFTMSDPVKFAVLKLDVKLKAGNGS